MFIFANCDNVIIILKQNIFTNDSEKSYFGIIEIWHSHRHKRGTGMVLIEKR